MQVSTVMSLNLISSHTTVNYFHETDHSLGKAVLRRSIPSIGIIRIGLATFTFKSYNVGRLSTEESQSIESRSRKMQSKVPIP